ncbi:Response regulator receiver domain protein [anaerobic digester metagenome]
MASSPVLLLVIEDNPADLRLLQELVREVAPGSFEIHSVRRLADGIAALRSRSYPVVLLDLSLPDGQGLSTIDAVRAVAPETPLIVLSGMLDEELVAGAHERGAVASFVKGSEKINELISVIRHLSIAPP